MAKISARGCTEIKRSPDKRYLLRSDGAILFKPGDHWILWRDFKSLALAAEAFRQYEVGE